MEEESIEDIQRILEDKKRELQEQKAAEYEGEHGEASKSDAETPKSDVETPKSDVEASKSDVEAPKSEEVQNDVVRSDTQSDADTWSFMSDTPQMTLLACTSDDVFQAHYEDKVAYTKGCKFSPDGLCILTTSSDDKARIFEVIKSLES